MTHLEEAKQRLSKPFLKYPNTENGFNHATADFQELMDWTLGTDCGEELNKKLDEKRWAMQDFYKKLHGWDIE